MAENISVRNLTSLPNIGEVLAEKLLKVGIFTKQDLIETGTKNVMLKIVRLEDSGVCLNMMYALEGAIQGIRWHGLNKERKEELKDFFNKTLKGKIIIK